MPRQVRPARRRTRRAALGLCTMAVASLAVVLPPAPPAAGAPPPVYRPPVDAPVLDPFRPPTTPYGPGNRGLEYGTEPGAAVRVAADGVVTFAGFVAGSRHVTVLHADGVRTTYSFLDRVDVVVGQRLRQGAVVGTTVGRLHLGARMGDSYIDPAALFTDGPPRVHLVPFDDPPGSGLAGERSAIGQLIGGIGGALGGFGGALGGALGSAVGGASRGIGGVVDVASWLRGEAPQLLGTLAHYAERFLPPLALDSALRTGLHAVSAAWAASHRPCTAGGVTVEPPAERRVAVLVAGLGSTSEAAAVDDIGTARLGYDEPDVVRFSYSGGRTPDPTDGFESIVDSAYGAADTQADLRLAGRYLADLVEDLTAAAPGVPLDVYAHSQGGLVVRLAVVELERRHGSVWLDRLGLVATIGTPHGGADLATGVHAIGSTAAGSLAFDGLQRALGLHLDDDATSVRQLGETSDLVVGLADEPPPDGLRLLSIAARGDLVVPVPRTAVGGATHTVVPLVGPHAHDALPGSPAVARELALGLAGLPAGCRSFASALTDQVVGQGISWAEDGLGALGWSAGAALGPPLGG